MGFSLLSSEVAGSTARTNVHSSPANAIIAEPASDRITPASPSLGFLGGLFLSEEVPEGWWGRLLGLSDLIENKLPS